MAEREAREQADGLEEGKALIEDPGSLYDLYGIVPENWESVCDFPEMPVPAHCELCAERCGGTVFVGFIIAFCVAGVVLQTSSDTEPYSVGSICRYVVYTEAAIAIAFLWSLQYLSIGTIHRSTETCFPIPEVIAERLRREHRASVVGNKGREPLSKRMRAAVSGQGNVRDPDGIRGVYCVRCFVWRPEDGHHCSECGRCVPNFDHHCGVLGCCVNGSGFKGNMWLFIGLISMAAVGFATCIGTMFFMTAYHPYSAHSAGRGGTLHNPHWAAGGWSAGKEKARRALASNPHGAVSELASAGAVGVLQMGVGGGLGVATAGMEGGGGGMGAPAVAAALAMARKVNGTAGSVRDLDTTFFTQVLSEVGKVARFACLLFFACLFFCAFYRGFMWLFYDRHAGKRRAKPTRSIPV